MGLNGLGMVILEDYFGFTPADPATQVMVFSKRVKS